jgi:hypothetical protein
MKFSFISVLVFFLASCTYYTERQSEAVSQNVYAANDSLSKARVDLAWFYSNETTKFIKPPKHPIQINSIYEAGSVVKGSKDGDKTRVVIIPDQYKGDKVVVVNSVDYQTLLKDRDIKKMLEQDNTNMQKQITVNNNQLIKLTEMRDKMVTDLNHLQAEVYKKDAIILKEALAIVFLLIIIGGYIALRVSKYAVL